MRQKQRCPNCDSLSFGCTKSTVTSIGSQLLEKVEQAYSLSKNYQQSPQGIQQLLQQYGKTKEDFRHAISMLNSPMISNTLGKISPNLKDTLEKTGNSLLNTLPESPQSGTEATKAGLSLRDRLSKL